MEGGSKMTRQEAEMFFLYASPLEVSELKVGLPQDLLVPEVAYQMLLPLCSGAPAAVFSSEEKEENTAGEKKRVVG